jgi:hypothetical protein
MKYPEIIYKSFREIKRINVFKINNLHRVKLPFKKMENSAKHPDIIFYDGTQADWKNISKKGSTIMFNSTIPTDESYYFIRHIPQHKFLFVNGSFFNLEDENNILKRILVNLLNSIVNKEKTEYINEKIMASEVDLSKVSRNLITGGIRYRLRAMSEAVNNKECSVLSLIPSHSIGLLVPINKNLDIANEDREYMAKQLGVQKKDIDIVRNPYYNSRFALAYYESI